MRDSAHCARGTQYALLCFVRTSAEWHGLYRFGHTTPWFTATEPIPL